MTDPQEFRRNRASFVWALTALASAMNDLELPEPGEIAVREDSDRVHVFLDSESSGEWVGGLSGRVEYSTRPPLSPKLVGEFHDVRGVLGSVRVHLTWLELDPVPPARPSLSVVD